MFFWSRLPLCVREIEILFVFSGLTKRDISKHF